MVGRPKEVPVGLKPTCLNFKITGKEMKKLLTLLLTVALLGLAGHKNASAGVCNLGTLLGSYHYQFYNRVGTFVFDGKGKYSLSGYVNNGGGNVAVTDSGTYTISTACIATVKSKAGTSLVVYLDAIDNIPTTRLAYHGTFMQGTMTRIFGKF